MEIPDKCAVYIPTRYLFDFGDQIMFCLQTWESEERSRITFVSNNILI
jgi:hypothetical protein